MNRRSFFAFLAGAFAATKVKAAAQFATGGVMSGKPLLVGEMVPDMIVSREVAERLSLRTLEAYRAPGEWTADEVRNFQIYWDEVMRDTSRQISPIGHPIRLSRGK